MEGLEENSDPRTPFKTSCFAKARDKSLRGTNLVLYFFVKSDGVDILRWMSWVSSFTIDSLKENHNCWLWFWHYPGHLLWATPCFWKVLKMFMKSQSQALGCTLFIELPGFLYSLKLENHVLWSLFPTLWVRLWRHGKESSLALADYIHLVHPPPPLDKCSGAKFCSL